MSELIKLDDGFEVRLGCLLPNEEQQAVMAMSPEYPENRMLEDKDIERALKGGFYLQHRKRLAPYMQNQNPLGSCNANALIGGVEQIRDNQGMPHIALSWNDAYMQMNGGRDQGSALIEAFRLAQTRGIAPRMIQMGGQQYMIPLNVFAKNQLRRDAIAAADSEAPRFRGWNGTELHAISSRSLAAWPASWLAAIQWCSRGTLPMHPCD